ncbi:transporter [Salinivirga cyanobacteriivorans]
MVQGQTTFLNRPSKTESAIVLEKGIFQMESTYETELIGESDEREKETLFPGIMLRYGLGWGIELRIANQYETYSDKFVSNRGFSDIDVGAKIKLFKGNDEETEVALISHFFLPTGSNGISNERVGNESLVLVWHGLTEKLGIEYNIGYSNFEIDSEKGNFVYSFVSDYEINDNFGLFIETYGELIEFKELEASFDFGLAYQLTDNLEFELAAGKGINYEMYFGFIGLSWRIGEQED